MSIDDVVKLTLIDYKYSESINLNTRISNSLLPIGAEDEFKGLGDLFNPNRKGKYMKQKGVTLPKI